MTLFNLLGPPPTKFGMAMAANSPMMTRKRRMVSSQERIGLGLVSESIISGNTGETQRLLVSAHQDSTTGEALAAAVRKYHLPDFSNWKNHAAFERAFARLEKDLRTSIGKQSSSQRDVIIQPRVAVRAGLARIATLGKPPKNIFNPNGVASPFRAQRFNPFRVNFILIRYPA